MIRLPSTDRAGWGWSGTAAATASTPRSPVTADFPRASRSSCAPPQPPLSLLGRRERPAPCRESAASFLTGPATDQRAAEDRGRSRAPLCRSRRACGNRLSRSPGRSLVWSKKLSTLSYLRRSKWRRSGGDHKRKKLFSFLKVSKQPWLFRRTVAGVPSDCVHVTVAVMEEEFMLGPFGSALKQIHEVMAVYLPAVPQKHAAIKRYMWRDAKPAFMEH